MNKHISYVSKRNMHLLQCPICKSGIVIHHKQMVCKNEHIFNIASNNYIDFHQRTINRNYSKESFQTRSESIENGLYRALESAIVKLLMVETYKKESLTILNVGCSEGALFSNILLSLRWEKISVISFGVDTTPENVNYASKQDKKTTWIVGSLENLPFKEHSIDIILNTFSSTDHQEFKRVLKPDGIAIKIMLDGYSLAQQCVSLDANLYENIKLFKVSD